MSKIKNGWVRPTMALNPSNLKLQHPALKMSLPYLHYMDSCSEVERVNVDLTISVDVTAWR